MQGKTQLHELMLYMAPFAVVVLVRATLVMEPDVFDLVVALGKEHKFMWILLFINSAMDYGANLCNFLVTKHTSALTLQVRLPRLDCAYGRTVVEYVSYKCICFSVLCAYLKDKTSNVINLA